MVGVIRVTVINCLVLFGMVVVLEVSFRVVWTVVKGSEQEREVLVSDDQLGWVLNPEHRILRYTNRCGEPVERHPPVTRYINRRPKVDGELKVLFLGDSFTHAHEVSTGNAYYDIFEQLGAGKYAVYVAGVSGYGTSQEFLLLKEVLKEVTPDILVLQMDDNDVSNNSFSLDNSLLWNNQRPRPYLDVSAGKYYVRDPGFLLFDVSRSFRYLFRKFLIVDRKFSLGALDMINELMMLEQDKHNASVASALDVVRIETKSLTRKFMLLSKGLRGGAA